MLEKDYRSMSGGCRTLCMPVGRSSIQVNTLNLFNKDTTSSRIHLGREVDPTKVLLNKKSIGKLMDTKI